jgi:demethylmenaquinone methyltransferase/2-methoxy-6-polyprenyl-1,4-benzoquinol methylase
MRDRHDRGSIPTGSQWVTSAGTSAVQLAWGTWRLSITRVPPTDADLTQAYDRASARWSSISTLLGYTRAYPELFTQLQIDGWLDPVSREACILDCGTGTGALIRALPADLSDRLHVHGMDQSPGMLARAALELGRLGRAVELHRADVRRLPFPSDRVDLVMSAHMLEHLPDPLEGLREMIRVLRPGGTLLLVTTRPSVPEAYLRLTWRYRTFDPDWLLSALRACGLASPRCYLVGRRPRLARWLSLAHVGRKPRETGPMLAAPSPSHAVGTDAGPRHADRPDGH